MSEHVLTVVARVVAKHDTVEQVREMLMGLVEPTRQEPGCIDYVLHQSKSDARSFLFFENWKSQADLDAHLQKPYLQAFVGKADEVLAEPLDITLWHVVGQ